MNIHYGQQIVLDSEGGLELGKGIFAHEVCNISGRKDNILIQVTLAQHGFELSWVQIYMNFSQ